MKFPRSKLEELVGDMIAKSIDITRQVVKDSGFQMSDIDEVILVGGQTRMPKIIEEVKKLFGKEPNRTINPDEVVAVGAAVQAGILQGDVKDVLLLDVTPLSLGIETLGGVMTPVIERNTTVPVEKSQTFSTAADNQPAVTVNVLQGERPKASDNVPLGKFDLDGIPPAPRGTPQIKVTFSIDANGILSVKAEDLGTKKAQHITISASNKLDKAEIEKFVKQAEQFAEEDKAFKEKVTAKNESDTLLFSAEKALKEHGDKVSAEDRQNIDRGISELKEALKGDDLAAINKAKEALMKASHKLAEEMYKAESAKAGATGGAPEGGPAGAEAKGKDNVVDAEVVDNQDKP
jgi:molecular chaperone DnaK